MRNKDLERLRADDQLRAAELAEDLALLQDVNQGLADVDAGRVVPHEEARARLMARFRFRE